MFDENVDPSIKEAAKQLAGSFCEIVELRMGPCDDITLVRPDGYIAYSAHNHDGIAALKAMRSLLGRQTHSGSRSSTTRSERTPLVCS
jgi:hypothetical protein